MPGQQNHDIVRQAVDRFKARSTEYAQGIAQRMGPPAMAQKLTNDEIVQMWEYTTSQNPAMDYQVLVSQGMPPAQALDKVFPHRSGLYAAPTVKERVAKAESIKKLVEEHRGGSD